MRRPAVGLLVVLVVLASSAAIGPATGEAEMGDADATGQSVGMAGEPAIDIGEDAVGMQAGGGPATDRHPPFLAGSNRVAGGGTPEPVPNSSARMVLATLAQTGGGNVTPSLGATLSIQQQSLGFFLDRLTTELRFAAADDDEREAVLDRALIKLEDQADQLLARNQRAISAYVNGEIEERTLLRRLAAIHRAAEAIVRAADRVGRLAQQAGITYLFDRSNEIRGLADPMTGPVRRFASETLAANGTLPEVHIEATPGAVVLAVIREDTFHREAYFVRNRSVSGIEIEDVGEAFDRAESYYPWTFDRRGSLSISGQEVAFRIRVQHPHGQLVTYLDAATGNVFREIHRLQLQRVPTRIARNVSSDDLRVVLNRTYPGGPMRIELYDVESGELTGGDVRLNNQSLGTVIDGTVWVIEPKRSYTVTVTSGTTTLTINVTSPSA